MFLRVQLMIFHNWFRQWLGTNQATSHHLNQWWYSTLTHISITRPQWVNMLNFSKYYKRYIHILNHILDLAWYKYMKLTLEQQYMSNAADAMPANALATLGTSALTSIALTPKYSTSRITRVNPLHAKSFRGNINIYLHFVSFLHIDMTQVVEIPPQMRQEPTYST